MMPAGRILPRPNVLKFEVLPAFFPGDPDFLNSRALAEAARQRILGVLGEPDLLDMSGDLPEAVSI